MGAWDLGPFDNDDAAEWSVRLDAAAPQERVALVREAFADVLSVDGYVDGDRAQEAVAAAAVVAVHLGAPVRVDPAYAPRFLSSERLIELPADLPQLAVRALDRVTGERSELRELWEGAGYLEPWQRTVDLVRTTLSPA